MSRISQPERVTQNHPTFYVDEAGDGVLFGAKGRDRLQDPGSPQFFMLGMVRCACDKTVADALEALRLELLSSPLYSSIPSMQPERKKTACFFHAKDDHAEIRAKVFELLIQLDFKFFAVVKDMRAVRDYVLSRNAIHADYRYKPDELYDLTVRMLFKQQLHKHDRCHITFARRGKSDRTRALRGQLEKTQGAFVPDPVALSEIEVQPAYPWEAPGLQVADYCLWALQRCYERQEDRFLRALWSKVSLIHDVDDPMAEKGYGTYLTRKSSMPNSKTIQERWAKK